MRELQKINTDYELALSNETREILKAIFEQGTAPNTLKAQSRDIKKFWQWAMVRFGIEETYPTPVSLIINYITDHLGGMSYEIDKKLVEMEVKKKLGSHKLSTIKRRLYSLSAYHNIHGVKPNPCRDKAVLAVIGKAHRAMVSNGMVVDKKEAATIEIMMKLIATCQSDGLKGVRDKCPNRRGDPDLQVTWRLPKFPLSQKIDTRTMRSRPAIVQNLWRTVWQREKKKIPRRKKFFMSFSRTPPE